MTSPVVPSVVKHKLFVWVQELDGILKVTEVLGISLILGKSPQNVGGEYGSGPCP